MAWKWKKNSYLAINDKTLDQAIQLSDWLTDWVLSTKHYLQKRLITEQFEYERKFDKVLQFYRSNGLVGLFEVSNVRHRTQLLG